MAILNTLNFTALVQQFAAAVQARATDLQDFSEGSILLAINEADAGNGLWLQGLIIQVLGITRAMTSNNTDLDTFMVQFMPALHGTVSAALPNGTPRIQAVAATGVATFARNSPSPSTPFIPVGFQVATADGSQQFTVYADPTNPAFSIALNGYTLAANTTSVDIPVQAVTPGSGGNVAINAISLLQGSAVGGGVDTVTNNSAFTNGVDQESDQQLRARFVLFIGSLSKGTEAAIAFAIVSIQVGMQIVFHEQVDPNGTTDYGMVTIYVDDGSGSPSSPLVTLCFNAAYLVRAAGVRIGVYGATTLLANYSMQIVTATGYDHPTVVGQVGNAVNNFINATGLENTLRWSQIIAVAYGIPGVTDVSSVLLNSGTNDLIPTFGQTIKVGTGSVS